MTDPQQQPDDSDSPWKEAIERYFEAFMELFFPEAHAGIDWAAGHEFLDKELQQVVRDAETGRGHVDKLARVRQVGGEETWVLAHMEVEGQPESDFPKRMYRYNYRLFDRYDLHVASFAVLADERPGWRPSRYEYELWGCKVGIEFPTVKLSDYEARWEELERSDNPFALLVRAYLKARATRKDPETRLQWKWSLIRELYEHGYKKENVLELLRFIDWFMALPAELECRLGEMLTEYEEEKKMPYVTSFERLGYERGVLQDARESVADVLEARFGSVPESTVERLRQVDDLSVLRTLRRRAALVDAPDDLDLLDGTRH